MTIIWIHPAINLILWIIYLCAGFGCYYFFWPTYGGWRSLDTQGKFFAVYCAITALIAMGILINTVPLPLS